MVGDDNNSAQEQNARQEDNIHLKLFVILINGHQKSPNISRKGKLLDLSVAGTLSSHM